MNRQFLYSLIIGLALASSLRADDGAFRMALDEANRGETDKAIADLVRLENANPSDGRIPLSLGLLYKDTNQHDLAIAELEKAHTLAPTSQGTYALGLLYESKWVHTEEDGWKEKAIATWEEYLKGATLDDPHRVHVEKHLRRLRNNG